MGTQIFYDCDALTDVTLGTGLTAIPASAFEHCDALETIVLPYRVASIGNNAFKNCVKLSSVTIPRATTSIGSGVFSYPSRMTIYGVAGTYAETYAANNSIRFVNQEVSATAASLSEKNLTMNNSSSTRLALTVTPANFTDAVSWKSSDTSVVTVADDGTVSAKKVGSATIKVVVGSVSASCKVTVVQPATSVSLNRTSATLEALDTLQLTATVNPSNAYDKSVSWASSNEAVATVDENGLVTAHSKGTATITVTALGGTNVSRSCTVTVSNNGFVVSQLHELESPHNYPDNCTDFWQYSKPGEEQLSLTFDERTEIEDGFDYLYLYDGNGRQIGKYTGTELAGVTVEIPGDTVRIKLESDDSGNEWGFKVLPAMPDPDLILPASLTVIEDEAFAGGAFRFVKLAENVESVGCRAFAECPNLSHIYIPAATTEISADAFGTRAEITIIGAAGSYAETYAQTHGFTFIVG